jgi:hypothetical protein
MSLNLLHCFNVLIYHEPTTGRALGFNNVMFAMLIYLGEFGTFLGYIYLRTVKTLC